MTEKEQAERVFTRDFGKTPDELMQDCLRLTQSLYAISKNPRYGALLCFTLATSILDVAKLESKDDLDA